MDDHEWTIDTSSTSRHDSSARTLAQEAWSYWMIGANAAPAAAYLGECFIRFLTRRAWSYAAVQDRRTLQYKDILDAIQSSEQCDFLIDVIQDFNRNRIQFRQTKDAQ
mmetsp:Transcript_9876/g.30262  ORF Transcript_9876/g.30262 Transcript_9876/m.30262 type:complete len:108 (-) Transcript_9876:756-1079(-)